MIFRLRAAGGKRGSIIIDGLTDAVRWAAKHVLIDQATLVRRLILIHTDANIDAHEIALLGQELLEHLE